MQMTGENSKLKLTRSISTYLGFCSSAICKASLTAEQRLVGLVSAAGTPGACLVCRGWAEDVLALYEDRALAAKPLNSDTDMSL